MRCLGLVLLAVVVGGCGGVPVENAERMNTGQLMSAAAKASEAGRVAEAGFLLFAAESRQEIDKQVYPVMTVGVDGVPSGTGLVNVSLSSSVSGAISRALAADPAAFKRAVGEYEKWAPKFEAGYDPGWKYTNALDGAAAAPIVVRVQKEMLASTGAKARLLGNAEYRKLADQANAVGKIETEYWKAANAKSSVAGVPEDLRKQFDQAQQKHAAVAKRMKEIELATNPEARWYARVGWKAEDYFEDAKVVALCKAIEDDNVPEMERLIAAGANAKAVGKDGMTPLLWAFPDRLVDRFECLLKHGADPNVVIQSDFGTKARAFHPYPIGGSALPDRGCHAGQSVTLLAARSPMSEYFNLVMEHGGDAKAIDGKTGEGMLDVIMDRSLAMAARERAARLIAGGADVNRFCEFHLSFPAMRAAQEMMFDVALYLLKVGADPKAKRPRDGWTLADTLVLQEDRVKDFPPGLVAERKALVDWLVQNGVSLDEARAKRGKQGK